MVFLKKTITKVFFYFTFNKLLLDGLIIVSHKVEILEAFLLFKN